MKKRSCQVLFFLALSADLLCIYFRFDDLRFVTKPLIVLSLLFLFLSGLEKKKLGASIWLLLGLLFSLAGDVLLLFEFRAPLFFLLGLSAFLLAQVFYSRFFYLLRVREGIRSKVFFLLLVGLYYATLIRILTPSLGELKLPVQAYGLAISYMLLQALHLAKLRGKKGGVLLLFGALLFVVSDTVLAINKFYLAFAHAGIIIMLTYALAQWLITEGGLYWLHTAKPVHRQAAAREDAV